MRTKTQHPDPAPSGTASETEGLTAAGPPEAAHEGLKAIQGGSEAIHDAPGDAPDAGTDAPGDAVLLIGESMTRMRVMMGRRVISKMAIARAAPSLDLSQLDVLDVVRRIGAEGGEASVGAVAEAMRLDPSRGSRMVAELVSLKLLRRQACQGDGRRSILRLTAEGDHLMGEIRAIKHGLIASATEDWSQEERLAFSALFSRFLDGLAQSYPPPSDSAAG
ncbi:MarR family winged helix-turn-helix transcriptional regulator [Rhizobium sp. SSA_523]|uniref:MarR family winged helix-turn-helix transcriptional regulator n=1 Tax=Rhizobium sp. SSA_523 TaxID=2952477 RepID=UPI0020908616|nr:MarR family winged helix-turn-helix transcriptional regulator [Rhizobium sp. SSA_523]MCO5730971.1 MarR family winged helix-turn-helix transcriptional regulator [Rhizobium sp. SSA_523]WKC24221.1 MarR family winged helix-turn-helix transcriptional regulator [Rhizobium sp. SSA_523]